MFIFGIISELHPREVGRVASYKYKYLFTYTKIFHLAVTDKETSGDVVSRMSLDKATLLNFFA